MTDRKFEKQAGLPWLSNSGRLLVARHGPAHGRESPKGHLNTPEPRPLGLLHIKSTTMLGLSHVGKAVMNIELPTTKQVCLKAPRVPQAIAVSPLFHAACAAWAGASGGRLHVSKDGGLDPLLGAQASTQLRVVQTVPAEGAADGWRIPEPGGPTSLQRTASGWTPDSEVLTHNSGQQLPRSIQGDSDGIGARGVYPSATGVHDTPLTSRGEGPERAHELHMQSSEQPQHSLEQAVVADDGSASQHTLGGFGFPRRHSVPDIAGQCSSAWDAHEGGQSSSVELAAQLASLQCLKRSGAAMAKTLLHYDGDVSRLLDVCRARIVFNTMEDLLACARLVCCGYAPGNNRAIRIRRVQNSMLPGYDGVLANGFRVSLSVFLLPCLGDLCV